MKEMRGLRSKQTYETVTLEPELITYLFDESREKKRIVRFEEVPDQMVKAVLAIEDRRFFSHPGLDPCGSSPRRSGTSRPSLHPGRQHHHPAAREELLPHPRAVLPAEGQEALLAFVLERRAKKKDILELYINEIYLGQVGSFGIPGSARRPGCTSRRTWGTSR